MRPLTLADLAPGDRVFRWWDTGAFGMTMQPLTVVRVNRKTVTVRTRQGSEFRMAPADIGGRLTEEEWMA